MDNSFRKFECMKCKKMHNIVIWKNIYKNNLYLCEKCWSKVDINLSIELFEKIIKLKQKFKGILTTFIKK